MRALGLLLLAVTGCQRGASSADAGLDITTARPFTLDLPALRAERTLGDLLAINLKYQQLLGVRLLPYDETMCKGGDAALLAGVKRFGDTLARDPKKMLEQVKHELAAPALHHAALLCQPDVIRLLVRRGAKVEAVDGHGLTALHWSSCEAATAALVELHASVTAKSTTGLTPLHLAIDRGSVAVLLAHGAELEAPARAAIARFTSRAGSASRSLRPSTVASFPSSSRGGCSWSSRALPRRSRPSRC